MVPLATATLTSEQQALIEDHMHLPRQVLRSFWSARKRFSHHAADYESKAMLALCEAAAGFQHRGSFEGYACKVIKNRLRDQYDTHNRRSKREAPVSLLGGRNRDGEEEQSPEDRLFVCEPDLLENIVALETASEQAAQGREVDPLSLAELGISNGRLRHGAKEYCPNKIVNVAANARPRFVVSETGRSVYLNQVATREIVERHGDKTGLRLALVASAPRLQIEFASPKKAEFRPQIKPKTAIRIGSMGVLQWLKSRGIKVGGYYCSWASDDSFLVVDLDTHHELNEPRQAQGRK